MEAERLRSGGLEYDAVWIRCRVVASFKPNEAIVSVVAQGVDETLDFFVDSSFVRPSDPPRGEQVDGEVQAILLEEHNDTLLVQIPGEPVSYGPKIPISRGLLAVPISL